jgi:hypothetical protein
MNGWENIFPLQWLSAGPKKNLRAGGDRKDLRHYFTKNEVFWFKSKAFPTTELIV